MRSAGKGPHKPAQFTERLDSSGPPLLQGQKRPWLRFQSPWINFAPVPASISRRDEAQITAGVRPTLIRQNTNVDSLRHTIRYDTIGGQVVASACDFTRRPHNLLAGRALAIEARSVGPADPAKMATSEAGEPSARATDTPHAVTVGLVHFFKRVARAQRIVLIGLGAVVLLAWAVHPTHLERLRAWLVIVKPNTAIGFALIGGALLLRRRPHASAWLSLALSTAAGVLGAASMVEYAFGCNLGIDEFLFKEFQLLALPPGRMSPATAVLFVMLSIALSLWRVRLRASGAYPTQLFAVAVALVSFVFLLGYAYDAPPVYRIGRYIPIALPTAAGFFVSALIILFIRPELGLTQLMVSDSGAGTMARRLLPAALVIAAGVAGVGWIRLRGQQAGFYNLEFGLALYVGSNVLFFTGLIWWTAMTLLRTEQERRAAEASLREAEEDLRITLHTVGDAVIATEKSGLVSRMNPVAEQLTGWSTTDARGRRVEEVLQLLDEETARRLEPLVDDVLRSGVAASLPRSALLVSRNGSRRAIAESCAPIRDNAGRIRGAVVVFRDQTVERAIGGALARSQSRFRVLAAASHSFTRGNLELPRLYQAIARHATEAIGDLCEVRLLSEDRRTLRLAAVDHSDPAAVPMLLEALRDGGRESLAEVPSGRVVITGEVLLVEENSLRSPYLPISPSLRACFDRLGIRGLLAVPLRNRDTIIGTITVARTSAGPAYTASDASLLTELSDRAGQAVHDAHLHHDLRVALDARDEFLAMAGHELRTPLTALVMQMQALRQGVERTPEAPMAEQLRRMEKSVLRLERLISRLLDVSRIAAGRLVLEPEEVDLAELTRDVVARFSDAAAPAQSAIVLRGAGRIWGLWDRSGIDQVLTHLLANALKYGGGEPVEIDLLAEEGEAVLRVTDHGIGIDHEHQTKIFERYERAGSGRMFGGLGLGLWMARKISEASGGSINVESSPGHGATFTVRLPRRLGPTATTA